MRFWRWLFLRYNAPLYFVLWRWRVTCAERDKFKRRLRALGEDV